MSFDINIKKIKPSLSSFDMLQEINDKIIAIQLCLDQRLSKLETQMDMVTQKCEIIMDSCIQSDLAKCSNDINKICVSRFNKIENQLQKLVLLFESFVNVGSSKSSNPVVLMSDKKLTTTTVEAQLMLDRSHTLVTLNSESDYPQGTWLGDEKNEQARVRVPISKSDLIHINSTCLTPEKMAITLLDYLFPREVLAESNLSGTGKHNKMKLDPLFVYAIQCHLKYKFNINDMKWFRIKQNIDSKCRALWRRKHVDGLSLGKNKVSMCEPPSEPKDVQVTILSETVEPPAVQPHTVEHSSVGEVAKFELCTSLFPTSEELEFKNNFDDLDRSEVGKSQRDFRIFRSLPEHLTRFQFVPQEVFPSQVLSDDNQDECMPLDYSTETLIVTTSEGEINVLSSHQDQHFHLT